MIRQCKFSPRVQHFKEDFIRKWNLEDYSNTDEPCVFVGYYDQKDITAIQQHNGYKILLPTGTLDLQKNQTYVNTLYQDKKVFFVKCWWANYPISFRVRNIKIPIKDYSLFKPNELGEKVYCYLGVEGNKNDYGFMLVEEVRKQIPFEVVYGFRDEGKNLPIQKLKENFYDKCFVNLNFSLSKVGGFTSVNELGFMGRKSITTSNRRENFLINFRKEENISKIIFKESKKIGTVQPSLMDDHFVGEEWLDMSYWFKK